MHSQFDSFELLTRKKLAGVQTPDLEAMRVELDALWDTIDDITMRPLQDFPIFEEVPIKDVPAIWGKLKKRLLMREVEIDSLREEKEEKRKMRCGEHE